MNILYMKKVRKMKILKQFGVIFGVCWISLVIEHYLPFSFPASVIGMVLLLICLLTGFLKIEHVIWHSFLYLRE